jgi:hypothetical protein
VGKHDDFDLIEEEDEGAGGFNRVYGLIGVALLVAFGFAVGLAYMTLSDRLRADLPDAVPTYTATSALVIGGTTATPSSTPTAAEVEAPATALPGTPPSPTATDASPTLTPPPAPPVACATPVDPAFGGVTAQLGCPLSEPGQIIWAAWEPFERGAMLWRSDTNRAYAFTNDASWSVVDASWNGQPVPSRGAPPPGLTVPERGFGYAWATDDELFLRLGWARDAEKGFCARVQEFERGAVLQSEAVPSCTPDDLYNHAAGGAWSPIHLEAGNDGRWIGSNGVSQSAAPPGVPAPTVVPGTTTTATLAPPPPTVTPSSQSGLPSTVEQATRPREQGRFFAPRAGTIALDGSFNEWPSDWIPVQAVVYDNGEYGGGDDLSARAQFAWNPDGLYIALRVRDDRFRPGPPGSDLWQGDSIELNVDRLLAQDFDNGSANDDDYQVGISFTEEDLALMGYRWLPFAQEGPFAPRGVMELQVEGGEQRGYNVETLLPWTLFDIDGTALPAQAALGFVLAVNDNDADDPRQATTIATSPARTTHDNPTQWGTLILLP